MPQQAKFYGADSFHYQTASASRARRDQDRDPVAFGDCIAELGSEAEQS
jgi:hypothetical protein